MANTNLTPQMITKETLRVLHQRLNFIGTIDRQYDKRFAVSGAKIGDTLDIRLPNKFTVTDGATLNVQDVESEKVSLQVTKRKHVGMEFSMQELTLDIDSFSDRYIKPAASVLAAHIENDAMSMYKSVYNEVSDVGAAITTRDVQAGGKKLTDNLADPAERCLNMNTTDNLELVDALKGLFNPNAQISENYKTGMVANQFLGYRNVYENTLWPTHTTGTDDGTGDYLTDGGSQTGATLTVDTGAGTFKEGDIIFIEDVYRVHPETKQSTGDLQQFVVTADVGASATSIPISPAIVASGAKQNVNAAAGDGKAIWKRESDESTAIGNAADYKISMGYAKDAFTFATADLEMPPNVWGAREVMDGISLRVVKQYNITDDVLPCRIDVLYGYKALRPELACRYGFN